MSLFMGGESTTSRAIVQSAGYAYRLSSQTVKEECHRHGETISATLSLAIACTGPLARHLSDHDAGTDRLLPYCKDADAAERENLESPAFQMLANRKPSVFQPGHPA